MKNRSIPRVVARLSTTATLLLLAVPLAAQQGGASAALPSSGLRAELIRDVEQLEQKYLGLAKAMAGKYDYRPGEGVRSMGDVLTHVASSNYMISTMVGAQLPASLRGATPEETRAKVQAIGKLSDPAQVQDALRGSFAHVRNAIATLPDNQLDETVKMFGQDATKRRVLNLLVTHMHEHLGQSIAYARANNVTPPWSARDS